MHSTELRSHCGYHLVEFFSHLTWFVFPRVTLASPEITLILAAFYSTLWFLRVDWTTPNFPDISASNFLLTWPHCGEHGFSCRAYSLRRSSRRAQGMKMSISLDSSYRWLPLHSSHKWHPFHLPGDCLLALSDNLIEENDLMLLCTSSILKGPFSCYPFSFVPLFLQGNEPL